MSRFDLGWNAFFEAHWQSRTGNGFVPARVVSQQRGLWRVAGDFAECRGEISGKMRRDSETGGVLPAVGDWVVVEPLDGERRVIIHEVLPRRSQFVRKAAGKGVERQVIVANVDTAFIVVGLDGDFNLRRIERYVAQGWESGARPVVLLNKLDQSVDPQVRASEAERAAIGVDVVLLSARTGQGVERLEQFLWAGQTAVLLGSSGAGKSTLLNRLLGREAQAVQAVREKDSRGRHTTTARQLIELPGGALIIDTPGLRELQLWEAFDGLEETFADIEDVARNCRFRDCGHKDEPGCAVRTAIASGSLEQGRLESLRKLLREQEFLRRKMDPGARRDAKNYMRTVERGVRQKYQQRDRDGGKR